MANQLAGEGQVFVCAACGKRSRDLYGYEKIDWGWDVSCMLHAVLCEESLIKVDEHGHATYKAVEKKENA